MAGKKLYMGKIMESMILKLDDTLLKNDEVIAELEQVRLSVLSGTTALNIKASDMVAQSIAHSVATVTAYGVGVDVLTAVKSGIIQATGTLKLKGTVSINKAGTNYGGLYYKLNGVQVLEMATYGLNVPRTPQFTLAVKANDLLEVGIWSKTSINQVVTLEANSLHMCYDFNDISESGIFTY